MFRKILLGIGVALLACSALLTLSYTNWSSTKFETLASGSKIIDTAAGPMEYVLKGDGDTVVLFLHGTPGGYDQGPDLTSGGSLLVPSRPGYLKTPLSVGETPAEQAKAYVALLDALEIEAVIVSGASGGGSSAITFAALYPERTIALIAIEAVSMSEENIELPWFMSSDFLVWLVFSTTGFLGDKDIVAMMIPDPANQNRILDDPGKIETIRSLMWSMWPPSLRGPGMNNDFDQFVNLSLPIDKITVPTLIIHGTADTNVLFSHGELLANTIPDSEFHVVDGGDHMMPFTHEEEVYSVIANFMAKVSSRTRGAPESCLRHVITKTTESVYWKYFKLKSSLASIWVAAVGR